VGGKNEGAKLRRPCQAVNRIMQNPHNIWYKLKNFSQKLLVLSQIVAKTAIFNGH
jgi:hypothetical protein